MSARRPRVRGRRVRARLTAYSSWLVQVNEVSASVDGMRDLEFGVFITPVERAARGRRRAGGAGRRRSGSTSSRFQDHPYQPRCSTPGRCSPTSPRAPAASGSRPNVLNLPLRPPAVMARAVAGLDLLSGGRVELGHRRRRLLGRDRGDGRPPADARPERRRAGGGDRRHPRALGRRAARVSLRRAATTSSSGAARGPAPAHDIGDLDRRLQAADARADRAQGRRLAAEPPVPAARRPRARATPRSTRRRGPRAATRGDPADAQPRAARRPVDELPRLAREDAHRHVHPHGRRPARDPALAGEIAPAVRERSAAAPAAARRPPPLRRPRRRAAGGDAEYDRLGVTPTPDDGARLERASCLGRVDAAAPPAVGPGRRPTRDRGRAASAST